MIQRDGRLSGAGRLLLGVGLAGVISGVVMAVQCAVWQGGFSGVRASLHHVGGLGAIVLAALGPSIFSALFVSTGPRGRVLAWRAVAVGSLAFALCHGHTITYALSRTWGLLSYFGRFSEVEPEYALVPIVAGVAAIVLAGRSLPSRARLRGEAVTAVVLAAGLLALGAVRGQRAPELHRYVRTLPAVGTIPAYPRPVRWDPAARDERPTRELFTIDGLVFARYVFVSRARCQLLVAPRAEDLPSEPGYDEPIECSEAQVIRRDRAVGIHVVHAVGAVERTSMLLLDDASGRPVRAGTVERVSAALRGRVSLPRAWWTDSLILWAISLGALLVPSRARRLLRGRDRWREGTLDDRRRVSLEDGTTFELPYGTNLAPGPIVVFTAGAARAGEAPFRASPVTEVPPRDAIAQGTGQSVSDGLEAELDGRLAYVSAIAMTAAAPWIAALATGLAP